MAVGQGAEAFDRGQALSANLSFLADSTPYQMPQPLNQQPAFVYSVINFNTILLQY